ncbi:unnamed protein product, partial [Brassica oleracea var. botrytis]
VQQLSDDDQNPKYTIAYVSNPVSSHPQRLSSILNFYKLARFYKQRNLFSVALILI